MFIDTGYIAVFFGCIILYLGYLLGTFKMRNLVEEVVNNLIDNGFLKYDEKTDELIPWREWNKK